MAGLLVSPDREARLEHERDTLWRLLVAAIAQAGGEIRVMPAALADAAHLPQIVDWLGRRVR